MWDSIRAQNRRLLQGVNCHLMSSLQKWTKAYQQNVNKKQFRRCNAAFPIHRLYLGWAAHEKKNPKPTLFPINTVILQRTPTIWSLAPPTTRFLGSGPATTSTRSSTNESISWFHSFHCCQTPSISPFSARPNRAAGELRDGEEREGAWNIPAVQRLLISYPLWFPRNMVFRWCVAVCTCEMKEREEIKKRSRRQDVFSQSLYMDSDLRFTSARLAV